MKILFCYPYYPSSDTYGNVETIWLNHIRTLNKSGFDVLPFCITPQPPAYALKMSELDRLWKTGNKELMSFYERLEKALVDCDVLLNVTGINLHPEFVEMLPPSIFKVYQFNDDPENTSIMSRDMAPSYDLCLVGNIAEVETYRSWGVKAAEWMPIGLQPHLYDPTLSFEKVLNGEREIDLFMMADKKSPYRTERLNKLSDAFPDAHFYGRGWKRGYLDVTKEMDFLLRSKICPNIHNSTGPINYRTFYAPANGMMLICDNKEFLGRIYELNKEAVGFDTIEECIELCNYYIQHDEERRWIAANGWRKAVTDYNEVAVFQRTIDLIIQHRTNIAVNSTKEQGIVEQFENKIRFSKWPLRLKYKTADSLLLVKKTASIFKRKLF